MKNNTSNINGYEWFIHQHMDCLAPRERKFVRIAIEKGDLVLVGPDKRIERPA